MIIPKSLRQQINVYCHHKAQAYGHELKAQLLAEAARRLKAGQTAEQVSNAILVGCSNNNAPIK